MKTRLLGLVLLLISAWLFKLFFFGQLDLYVLQKYIPLVIITASVLFITAVFLFFHKLHGVEHHVSWKSLFILLIPCIFGFSLSPAVLSSTSVTQRGIQTDLSTVKISRPVNFNIDSKERDFADWISILESSSDPLQYVGEEIRLQGFVFHDDTMPPNEFLLSRFILRCCTADARPVAMKVITSESLSWKNDQWLELEGVFQASKEESGKLEVQMQSAKIIDIPDNPYIN